MDIKQKIGLRIANARKNCGLTVQELAARTGTLKAARISNWEQGTRTPGPLEVKQLSLALNVSAAYLMGLVEDDSLIEDYAGTLLCAALPILAIEDIMSLQSIAKAIQTSLERKDNFDLIPITKTLSQQLGKNAYALKIQDDSMQPDFKLNDLIILDPQTKPKPGQYVLAKVNKDVRPIFRKYREINRKDDHAIELIALNSDWPNKIVDNKKVKATLLGTLVEMRRNY